MTRRPASLSALAAYPPVGPDPTITASYTSDRITFLLSPGQQPLHAAAAAFVEGNRRHVTERAARFVVRQAPSTRMKRRDLLAHRGRFTGFRRLTWSLAG